MSSLRRRRSGSVLRGGGGRRSRFVDSRHELRSPPSRLKFEHFARRNYRVVAVDLHEHGKGDHHITATLCDSSQMTWHGCAHGSAWKPVVIGHSMGGVVALALRYLNCPRPS